MQFIIDILLHNLKELISYLSFYLVSLVVFHYISKNKSQRNIFLNSLQIVQVVLNQKLNDKSNTLLSIWLDGLKKVQDGEFSNDDKIDQFLRYIKLMAQSKGINLTDSDLQVLHTLILSNFVNVDKVKPQIVAQSVNKFSAMNHID